MNILPAAVVLEGTLLSLGLAHRIRSLQIEKAAADDTAGSNQRMLHGWVSPHCASFHMSFLEFLAGKISQKCSLVIQYRPK